MGIKIENTNVYNIYPAIKSIRNALKSWDKSDTSSIEFLPSDPNGLWRSFNHGFIGLKDLELAKRLISRGGDERKFMREIFVNADITTTVNHWSEIDTYCIGKVRNSTSTMHSLLNKEIAQEDFDNPISESYLRELNEKLNLVKFHKNSRSIEIARIEFKVLKDMLPSGYLIMSNYSCNYELLLNMYLARKNHYLLSWIPIIKWIESLPYFVEFLEELK